MSLASFKAFLEVCPFLDFPSYHVLEILTLLNLVFCVIFQIFVTQLSNPLTVLQSSLRQKLVNCM